MTALRDQIRLALHVAVLAPIAVALAVTMFAWPAARTAARSLPVGIVGTSASSLARVLAAGNAFTVHHYADDGAARTAITDRDVYGVFAPAPGELTVYLASAASPAVAQELTAVADQAAARTGAVARPVDVVPTSTRDPRGTVLSSAVLPLVFGGEIIGVVVALLVNVQPARRQLVALAVASAAAGAAAYAIAQDWLGALPHQPLATWGALALTLLAISATAAGLFALLGVRGVGIAAATMIFLGNPFSGVTSAPELLPAPAGWLGRLLPPGAGGELLRSTAYFGGHGAFGPACVLVAWVLAGAVAVLAGHRRRESGRPTRPRHQRYARRRTALEPAG